VSAPLVSVIIPTCDRAEPLRVAISSVLAQTFQDFEIVVVDDAASDATREVVDSFGERRMQYIRHPARRGGSAARNTGIRASRADCLAFLDDDDEWFPTKLQKQMELFRRSAPTVGLVYTGYLVVERKSGRILGRQTPSKRGELADAMLASNLVGGTSCVAVKRKYLEMVGSFDERLPSFQDYDLAIRLSRVCQFEYTAEPLLTYYIHDRKVWTDPDAIRGGLDIMMGKYGSSRAFRRLASRQLLDLGVKYGYAGRDRDCRNAFRLAIELHPTELRGYFYLVLSLLGARRFSRLREFKKRAWKRAVAGRDERMQE
jgi:glycosyltransferase involved in cell wall biosynthesis